MPWSPVQNCSTCVMQPRTMVARAEIQRLGHAPGAQDADELVEVGVLRPDCGIQRLGQRLQVRAERGLTGAWLSQARIRNFLRQQGPLGWVAALNKEAMHLWAMHLWACTCGPREHVCTGA